MVRGRAEQRGAMGGMARVLTCVACIAALSDPALAASSALLPSASEGATDSANASDTASPSPSPSPDADADEPNALAQLPSLSLLRNAVISDLERARPTLRRVARSAPDPERRAIGLRLLAEHDPGGATARICARALRTDIAASVRRAGAECLGRMPAITSGPHVPVLIAALEDRSLNVVTMAGWSLSVRGEAAVIEALHEKTGHPDTRVAALFREYAARAEAHAEATAARATGVEQEERALRVLAPADQLFLPRLQQMELGASAVWLATGGAVLGWYHGGILAAADGSSEVRAAASLSALVGGVVGAALGAGYALTGAQKLVQSHAIVQLGGFGWLTGFGAGVLGGAFGQAGLDVPAFALAGTIVGTGLGVGLADRAAPSPGGLAWGMTAALGAGLAASSIATHAGFSSDNALSAGFLVGGLAGGVTTLCLAPLRVGVAPALLASAGGLLGAQAAEILGSTLAEPGSETRVQGWWSSAGLLAGASLAALAGSVWLPRDLDPFAGRVRIDAPQLAFLPPQGGTRGATPVALMRAHF